MGAGWAKISGCLWIVFKGILNKVIVFPTPAPLAFCLRCFLPHTSYNIPEGVALPYGLGWHQFDDVHEKKNRRSALTSQSESLFPGIRGSFDLTDVTVLK